MRHVGKAHRKRIVSARGTADPHAEPGTDADEDRADQGIVNLIPDIRKMERVVGWKPQVYFEEGMKRILAFQK